MVATPNSEVVAGYQHQHQHHPRGKGADSSSGSQRPRPNSEPYGGAATTTTITVTEPRQPPPPSPPPHPQQLLLLRNEPQGKPPNYALFIKICKILQLLSSIVLICAVSFDITPCYNRVCVTYEIHTEYCVGPLTSTSAVSDVKNFCPHRQLESNVPGLFRMFCLTSDDSFQYTFILPRLGLPVCYLPNIGFSMTWVTCIVSIILSLLQLLVLFIVKRLQIACLETFSIMFCIFWAVSLVGTVYTTTVQIPDLNKVIEAVFSYTSYIDKFTKQGQTQEKLDRFVLEWNRNYFSVEMEYKLHTLTYLAIALLLFQCAASILELCLACRYLVSGGDAVHQQPQSSTTTTQSRYRKLFRQTPTFGGISLPKSLSRPISGSRRRGEDAQMDGDDGASGEGIILKKIRRKKEPNYGEIFL